MPRARHSTTCKIFNTATVAVNDASLCKLLLRQWTQICDVWCVLCYRQEIRQLARFGALSMQIFQKLNYKYISVPLYLILCSSTKFVMKTIEFSCQVLKCHLIIWENSQFKIYKAGHGRSRSGLGFVLRPLESWLVFVCWPSKGLLHIFRNLMQCECNLPAIESKKTDICHINSL